MFNTEVPEHLKPYEFLGLDLHYKGADTNAIAECPFCGKEKFSIVIESGQFRCFGCSVGDKGPKGFNGGNIYVFLRKLWEVSFETTKLEDRKALAQERKYLDSQGLVEWGIGKSILTGHWLVPGYNVEGKMTGLYQWIKSQGKNILYPIPGLGLHLHGVNLYEKKKEMLFLCEGWGDGIGLWELLVQGKEADGGLVPTGSRESSLYAISNVLAVPGCESFLDVWYPLFAGKIVNLMFDNDHERIHPKTNQMIPPAGLNGMKRIAGILSAAPEPPKAINYLQWGKENGWNANLPTGFDIRDYVTH